MLSFSSKSEEIPFTVDERRYVLREATGEAAAIFRNASQACARLIEGKLVGMQGVGDLQPLLVSLTSFEVYEVGGETKLRSVLLSTVKAWPDRIVDSLFDEAVKLSPNLAPKKKEDRDKEETAAKNGQLPAADGSVQDTNSSLTHSR